MFLSDKVCLWGGGQDYSIRAKKKRGRKEKGRGFGLALSWNVDEGGAYLPPFAFAGSLVVSLRAVVLPVSCTPVFCA
jgi:hypothetical protein